jgi:S-formylglutathione hydrolase
LDLWFPALTQLWSIQEKQLLPEALDEANSEGHVDLKNRLHEGYDHSYFFVQSFIPDHMRFHAVHLGVSSK